MLWRFFNSLWLIRKWQILNIRNEIVVLSNYSFDLWFNIASYCFVFRFPANPPCTCSKVTLMEGRPLSQTTRICLCYGNDTILRDSYSDEIFWSLFLTNTHIKQIFVTIHILLYKYGQKSDKILKSVNHSSWKFRRILNRDSAFF